MSRMVYLIGLPGAGKSTLVQAAFYGWDRASYTKPIAHARYRQHGQEVWELGARREAFSGTDALSMAALPLALDVLIAQTAANRLWIAEGDRLATPKFWDPLRAAGWEVAVVRLYVSDDLAAARRRFRGSDQDEKWVRGRATKLRNLGPHVTRDLLGGDSLPTLVAQLRGILGVA